MHDLPLITTLAAAFTAALVFGLITQRLGLSPIVGYLIAGVAIGPHTPGIMGDVHLAGQLAEVGVILLMFGVGLHFHLSDLLAVKDVAVPGALGQAAIATGLGLLLALAAGMGAGAGLVLGAALAFASTVVLTRVLSDAHLLETTHGHVAVGWLVVQDVVAVLVLVLVPTLAGGHAEDAITPSRSLVVTLWVSVAKLGVLVAIVLLAGSRLVPWMMVRVARLRSRELFTLSVLVMAIAVAAGSSYVFGASTALGAFLAGMVVGQSPVSQQAAADALPLRDAFAVLFFASVGMLVDPHFPLQHPLLLLGGLAVVMVGNPLAAMGITSLVGYPARTALVVGLGLSQIGEFSFILSQLGRQYGLLSETAHNLIVSCAIVSITVNPLLFRSRDRVEGLLKGWVPGVWRLLGARAERRVARVNAGAEARIEAGKTPVAVIVGYGPVGRTVDEILRGAGRETVVVDLNIDTVSALLAQKRDAIFGDAFNIEVMHTALARATHLIITLPHAANRTPLIAAAKLINPGVRVFVRAHYIAEREDLVRVGADGACFEELEAAVALSKLVLADQGADGERIRSETMRIRQRLSRYGGADPSPRPSPRSTGARG